MLKCEICGAENVSLLYARHKNLNRLVKICPECWRKAYAENRLVSGSGVAGGCCG